LGVQRNNNKQLCAQVVQAFTRELSRSLKHRAKRQLGLSNVRQAHTGSVTFVQRFDSALRLNVHLHVLALDGVYVQDERGTLTFYDLDEPTADEVAEVAQRTALRIRDSMLKLGLRPDPALEQTQGEDQLQLGETGFDDGQDATDAEQHPALLACYSAATQGLDLFAERAGQPSLRLVDPSLARPTEPHAVRSGINVHAKLCIDADDRARLEQLCRYLARPPIAQERLTRVQWVEVATTPEALTRLLADHDLADSELAPQLPLSLQLQHAHDPQPEQLRFCFD